MSCTRVWLQLVLVAVCVATAAGARLEISRQPVGNERKGFPLSQQPRIQVVLDAVDEVLPAGAGTVNSLGGVVRAPIQRDSTRASTTIDVTNSRTVTVTFGSNPVGATFAGGVSVLQVKMVQGVADFSDIQIIQGGSGFTLTFTVPDAQGDHLTVESSPFNCGGQEAKLVIKQQPVLTVQGATARMTPPILHVVDPYSNLLAHANPVVTVSLFANPGAATFSASSLTAVSAKGGVVMMDKVFLTNAVTELEPEMPAYLEARESTRYRVRFSSPGYPDVTSAEFETLPLLHLENQPASDHTRIVTKTCAGNVTGCQVMMSDYLQTLSDGVMQEKLQSAHLHVDVACTDLDGPDEFVTGVRVGNRRLTPGAQFATGPWEECGFAGCRGECDTNKRRVVSALNVKDDIGIYDSITGIYKSMGAPLRVHVAVTDKVNICPCDAQPLKLTVTLIVTYSQAPELQGTPMIQQPRVLLLNADGSLYTLRQKFVEVTFATAGTDPFDATTAFGNPSGAQITGMTRKLSEGGVVQFTDVAITEGGKGYVLRFTIRGIFTQNSTTILDSQPLNVGCGNFPKLTLDCVDCSRPAPSRQEARSLSQPPQLELLRTLPDGSTEKSSSYIKVAMSFGVNGPAGMFSPDSVTTKNADSGSIKFSDTTIFNGNCAFCPASTCGEGYTLYFIANDFALESQAFDIAGGNRSPRFIAPTPAAGAVFEGIMGVPKQLLTLNITDDNHNSFALSLTTGQHDAVSCKSGSTCFNTLDGGQLWGGKREFEPRLNDDDCSRPLFAGNGPASPADGYYWGSQADILFSATCAQAGSSYPPAPGQALASEKICFMPTDKVTTVDPPISTHGKERCFEVEVLTAAAPFFLLPFRFNHTQARLPRIAELSAEQAVEVQEKMDMLRLPPPLVPTYVPPHAGGDKGEAAMADEEVTALYVGVGCRIVLPLAAAELQTPVMSAAVNGTLHTRLMVHALRTTRSSLYEQVQLETPLPQGARMHEGALANPHVSSFEWEPMQGQEGFVYTVCFEIMANFSNGCIQRFYTAPYHGHASQYCVDIHVERCKYCMRSGESLEALARTWHTTVMQLWSGNPTVLQPNLLSVGTLLNLGIVYTADIDDRLPHLAHESGRTIQDLLTWNPDLPRANRALVAGEQVLLSSATMYEHRQAPWAVRNGTFVSDSQTVCILPNICTYAAVPEGKVEVETSSFTCTSCQDDTEFCTGAICVNGQGDGPWSQESCSTYLGTRCERCVACRAEEFDVNGHISVPGFWRSGGCDGAAQGNGVLSGMAESDTQVMCKDCTRDAVCSPCTLCSDGEVEVSACTPLRDRVCVATGATVGAGGEILPPMFYKGSFLPAHK